MSELQKLINQLDVEGISSERKQKISEIAGGCMDSFKASGSIAMNFICIHNARRSHLAQVWAWLAAQYFGLDLRLYSGGTEVTAVHPNAIRALEAVGFFVEKRDEGENPIYRISFQEEGPFLDFFSKMYNHESNQAPYIAVMVCSEAEDNFPFIQEAIARFSLPFNDPKFSDGTGKEPEVYQSTSIEIGSQMFYLIQQIKLLMEGGSQE